MKKHMGKVPRGSAGKKFNTKAIFVCGATACCCAILAFSGIGGNAEKYSVAKAVDVGSLTQADAEQLKSLYSSISDGVETYTDLKIAVDGLTDKKLSSAQLSAKNGGDTQVTLGGLKWDLVYVSETTAGDVIATLWLAETEEKASFANNWYANNTDYKYPSDMYGTSYIRSYLTGSSYAAEANVTALTAGNANAEWKSFIESYGNYISSPSQVEWQLNQSGKDEWDFDLTNESAGEIAGADFYSDATINKDYTQKEHYFDWSTDRLWLPSLTETGITGNSTAGVWELTGAQASRTTNYTMLRSGSPDSADGVYSLTGSGGSYVAKTDLPMFVRPAFHLNLRAVAQSIGEEALIPEVTPEAQGAEGLQDGLTYNGAMQAAVQFNPTKAEVYSASWTDENGATKSISSGETADWIEISSNGKLSVKHAGNYTVQFKLAGGVAEWADGDSGMKSVTFKVNRYELLIDWALNGVSGNETAGYYWVYDGVQHGFGATVSTNQSIDITGLSTALTVKYQSLGATSWSEEKPVTVGKYTVAVSLASDDNDYKITGTRAFEIRKRALGVNWLTDGAQNTETNGLHWIYDANTHKLSAELVGVSAADNTAEKLALTVRYAAKGAGAALSDIDEALEPKDAGTYTAFATLSGSSKDNYYLSDSTGAEISYASQVYKITQREVTVTWAKNPENGTYVWVYSGYSDRTTFIPSIETQAESSTGDTGVITGQSLNVSITYATVTDGVVGEYDDNARVNAGIYKVQATQPDKNYKLVNAVLDYEISKLEVTVEWTGTGTYGSDGEIMLWRYDGASHAPTAKATVPATGAGSVSGGDDLTSQIEVAGSASEVTSLSAFSARGYYEAVASFTADAQANSVNNYKLVNSTQKFRIDKGLVTGVTWYAPDAESESGISIITESPSYLWGDVKGPSGPGFTAEATAKVQTAEGEKEVKFTLNVTYPGANYADSVSWPVNEQAGYTAKAVLTGRSADGSEDANRFELKLKGDNGEVVSCDSIVFYILPKAADVEEITVTWVVFTDGTNYIEINDFSDLIDGATLNSGGHASVTDGKFAFVYTGKPQSPTAIYKYTEVDEEGVEQEKYEILPLGADSKRTDAGTWTAYLKPTAKYNYKSGTAECEYEITPLTIKLDWGTLSYEYNGKERSPAPKIDSDYLSGQPDWYQSIIAGMQVTGGELSKITASGATDAGEYIVKPNLGANFAYTDGTGEAKLTITRFAIVASSVVWTFDDAKNDTMGADGKVTDDDAWYWTFDGTAYAPTPSLTVSLDGETTITLKLGTTGATGEVGEHYAFAWLDTSDPQNKNYKLIESKDNPVQAQARRKFTIARIEITAIFWAGAEVIEGDGYTGATIEIDGALYQLSENGATELQHIFDGNEWSPKAYYKVGESYAEMPVEGGMRNVGKYVARVSGEYNLKGEDGKALSRECKFSILPKEITVTWQQSDDGGVLKFEYTGKEQHPSFELSDGVDGEEITYKVTGYTDAGNYKSVITFTNPNYTYAGKSGEANVCDFIIVKKSITVGWSYTGNAGMHGEDENAIPYWQYSAKNPEITVNSVNGEEGLSITMPDFGEVTFTFGYTGLSSGVGTHTAKAVITGATLGGEQLNVNNFEIATAGNAQNYEITVYEVQVKWKGNAANDDKFEWTYDGLAHAPTAEYLLWDDEWHTATVTGGRTVAGSYTAHAVMPAQYVGNCVFATVTTEQEDGTEIKRSAAECDFVINKAKVTVRWTFAEAIYNYADGVWELQYDGSMHAPKAYDKATNTELNVTGAVADAGNRHIASASLPDAANYEFATENDNFCYFTIKVKTVWIKWLDDSGEDTPAFSWYYATNKERAPKAILANEDGSEFLIDGNRVYAIVSGGAVHAGEYTATAEIVSSNYAFPADKTFTQQFRILKLELNDTNFWWSDADKLTDGWYCYEFNGQSQHPTAETRNFTEFSYEYAEVSEDKTDGAAIDGITDAGYYKVSIQIVNNNDYSIPDGKGTVYVKITPRTVAVKWSEKHLIYNGENQSPEAYYEDVNGAHFNLEVRVNEAAHKDAGEKYHATAAFISPENVKNYVLDEETIEKEFEIFCRSLTVKWHEHEFDYDNEGHFVTSDVDISNAIITDFIDFDTGMPVMGLSYVILDHNGDVIKNENGNPVQSVINAGNYKMVLSLTGPDSVTKNYALNDTDDSDNQQAFTILKRILVVTADDKEVKYGAGAPVFTATYGEVTYVEDVEKIIHTLIGATEADIPGLIVNGKRPWLNCKYVPGSVPNDEGYDIEIDITMLSALLPNYTFVDADGNSTCHTGKIYVKASETTVIWYGDPVIGDPNFEYDGKEHMPEAYLYKNPDRLEVIYVDEDGNAITDENYKAVKAGTYYVKAIASEGVTITEQQIISYEIKPREVIINIKRVDVTYGDRQVSADGSDILTETELKTLWEYATAKHAVEGEELGVYFTWNVADSIKNGYLNSGVYYLEGKYNDDPNYKIIFEGIDNDDAAPDKKQYGLYVVNNADITDNSKQGTEWFYEERVIEKYEQYFIRIEDKEKDEVTGEEVYRYIQYAGDQSAEVTFSYSTPYLVGRDEIPEPDENENYPNTDKNHTGISDKGVWFINYRIDIPNHNTYYGRWTVLIKRAEEYVIIIFVKPYEIQYGDDVPANLTELLVDEGYVEVKGAITDKEYFKSIAEAYVPLGYNKYVTNRTKVGKYNPCFRLDQEKVNNDELDVIYRDNNRDEDSNLGMYVIVPRQIHVVWGQTEFTYDKELHLPMPVLSHWIEDQMLVLEGIENGKAYITTDAGATITVTVTTEGNFKSSGGHRVVLAIDDPNYTIAAAEAVQVISIKGTFPWWLVFLLGALTATAIIVFITLIVKLRHRNQTIAAGITDREGFYDPLGYVDDAGFGDPYYGSNDGGPTIGDDGFDYDEMWSQYTDYLN